MFWGLSPALDLIAEVKKVKDIAIDSEINVLLIGSTDARHILKTISRLKRHSKDLKVNFFVLDSGEVLVRQMLLLTIALEPSEKLGPFEKSRIWMEVYGNTLLRSSTAKYVIRKMYQLRLMIYDKGFLERRMPLMDLSLLRYSDQDYLDEVAKYYQNNKSYAISRAWDGLLRVQLEADYDYRFTNFDFDYCGKLVLIPGGHRVCKSEYIHWRNTGIAFTWLETEYSVGNPTLAVGIGSSGDSLYSLGYWGDMESGPFYAFGTDSEEKPMLEVRNDVNVRRATDITERNLQRMFHELEHGSPPSDLYSASIDLGLVMMKPGYVDVEREVVLDYEPDRKPEDYSAIPVPNCKVYFLPGNAMDIFPKKAKNKEFFDIIYVAQNFFKFLNEEIMTMIRPSGCLIIETRKFVILLQEDPGCFGKEVRNKLKEFGWIEVKKYHFRKDDHVLFKKSSCKPSPEDDGQKDEEAAGITDDSKKMMEQDLSENIVEECSQLNLEDTKDASESMSEESENAETVRPENASYVIKDDQNIKGGEIVTPKCEDDISITSLDETEFDPTEDSEKKITWMIPMETTQPGGSPSEEATGATGGTEHHVEKDDSEKQYLRK